MNKFFQKFSIIQDVLSYFIVVVYHQSITVSGEARSYPMIDCAKRSGIDSLPIFGHKLKAGSPSTSP